MQEPINKGWEYIIGTESQEITYYNVTCPSCRCLMDIRQHLAHSRELCLVLYPIEYTNTKEGNKHDETK